MMCGISCKPCPSTLTGRTKGGLSAKVLLPWFLSPLQSATYSVPRNVNNPIIQFCFVGVHLAGGGGISLTIYVSIYS